MPRYAPRHSKQSPHLTRRLALGAGVGTMVSIAAATSADAYVGTSLPTLPDTPKFSVAPGSNTIDPMLRGDWTYDPFPGLASALTTNDKTFIAQCIAAQRRQSWWTYAAIHARTVTRTVTTVNIGTLLHTKPTFASKSTALIRNGESITGHYVDPNWFAITSGRYTGLFVSTACVHYNDIPRNGLLAQSALVTLPNYLRANTSTTSAYLNPQAAKQLVYMNAAWRMSRGTNLRINEGYRTLETQKRYYKDLGPDIAQPPGNSNHGLGLAMDISANPFPYNSAGEKWINSYASYFGFNRPSIYDNPSDWEAWHINFVG